MRLGLVFVLALAACKGAEPDSDTDLVVDTDDTDVVDADDTDVGDTDDTDVGDTDVLDTDDTDIVDTDTGVVDADGDGFPVGADCDDGDDARFPGAAEVCNGVDDDCDLNTDEAAVDATSWYFDGDADGHGDAGIVTEACEAPSGYVAVSDDCDDGDASRSPGSAEVCDGIDQDCDGQSDDGLAISAWYGDDDGDGYGDAADVLPACRAPLGYVDDATDCDDNDALVHPGAPEQCDGADNDCDALVDAGDPDYATYTWYADADGDGHGDPSTTLDACAVPSGYVDRGDDCDDAAATTYPLATEICDSVDQDCDGAADDGLPRLPWYADADGDAFGVWTDVVFVCGTPAGRASRPGDCDDGAASAFPGATEVCDGVDQDCDGAIDDGFTLDTWFGDRDADGFGDTALATAACVAPDGYVATGGDCDDDEVSVFPGAAEVCDGRDQDCDGSVDEGASAGSWFADADGDGFGDASVSVVTCSPPSGYVTDDTDCDDNDGSVSPGATEVCDGVDQDCDGAVDDGALGTVWYADADGDTYGDPGTQTTSCGQPSHYVANRDDCDDADAARSPGATEVCDGIDDDCDGAADDGLPTIASYPDTDGDGFGDASQPVQACAVASGRVTDATDCDDADADVSPAALEVCGGTDEDCDGLVDGADPDTVLPVWYADADTDGFGDGATTVSACARPSGFAATDTDCDDAAAVTHPGAPETCDGADNGCDGAWVAADEDGTVSFTDHQTGVLSDVSAAFAAGTSSQPALVSGSGNGRFDLCAGTWYARIEFDGALEVVGAGRTSTTLDAVDSGSVIWTRSGGTLTVRDLTVTGGQGAGGGLHASGVLDASRVDVVRCDAPGDSGGGVSAEQGGAITDLDIHECSAQYGGGLSSAQAIVVTSTSITDCTAVLTGGGAVVTDATIVDSEVAGNHARLGGGIRMFTNTGITSSLTRTVVSDNRADDNAGALWVGGPGDIEIVDTSFLANEATGYGGGVHVTLEGSASVAVSGSTFAQNVAGRHGGGMSFSPYGAITGSVTIAGSVFDENVAGGQGGGLMLGENADPYTPAVDVSDTMFTDNVASTSGGGAMIAGQVVDLADTFVARNSAMDGGGLYLRGTTLDLVGLVVEDNAATQYGGGIVHIGGTATLIDSSITNNTGGYQGGGLTLLGSASLTVTDGVIADNTGLYGGGVYAGGSSFFACEGSATGSYGVFRNLATDPNAAAVDLEGGTLVADLCDFGVGADDNAPHDLRYQSGGYAVLGDDVTATCDSSGCH